MAIIAFPTERAKPATAELGIFAKVDQARLIIDLSEFGITHGYDRLFETVTLAFERYELEVAGIEGGAR